MTITHNNRHYAVLGFTYPRRGNMYYDREVNRVKMAGRNINSRKHIIIAERVAVVAAVAK